MGLAISKGIVEAHEGIIWAENRPGGGEGYLHSPPRCFRRGNTDFQGGLLNDESREWGQEFAQGAGRR
ncbi:MAG: hypothetical protein ACM3N7_06270 [Planctomycetaceae bacterium]